MGLAIAEREEHHHTFKVRYKFVDGQRIMIDPACKCAGCDKLAFIRFDGYRIMVTFIGGSETQISYTAVLAEEHSP